MQRSKEDGDRAGGPVPAPGKVTIFQASALDQILSQVGASAAVLSDLASTPVGARPRSSNVHGKSRVDVVLAAPTKQWAELVAAKLRIALGQGVDLMPLSAELPESNFRSSFTLRYSATVPGTPTEAKERVGRALHSIPEVDVDYSEPIDLFVAKARA
jgi:hypothetical protein